MSPAPGRPASPTWRPDLPALREKTLIASLGGPVGTLAGLGHAAEAVGRALRQRTRARRGAGHLAHQPRPHGGGRRVAGDADRHARAHGDRRRVPLGDRDRRGERGAGGGPRRLVGHAAQAEPAFLRGDPVRACRRARLPRHPPQCRRLRPAASRPACGRRSGTPSPLSSALPPVRSAKRDAWPRALRVEASACAPIST